MPIISKTEYIEYKFAPFGLFHVNTALLDAVLPSFCYQKAAVSVGPRQSPEGLPQGQRGCDTEVVLHPGAEILFPKRKFFIHWLAVQRVGLPFCIFYQSTIFISSKYLLKRSVLRKPWKACHFGSKAFRSISQSCSLSRCPAVKPVSRSATCKLGGQYLVRV